MSGCGKPYFCKLASRFTQGHDRSNKCLEFKGLLESRVRGSAEPVTASQGYSSVSKLNGFSQNGRCYTTRNPYTSLRWSRFGRRSLVQSDDSLRRRSRAHPFKSCSQTRFSYLLHLQRVG
jgi:hypothetical protein